FSYVLAMSLLCCRGVLRDLPSFPTRRSSDLHRRAAAGQPGGQGAAGDRGAAAAVAAVPGQGQDAVQPQGGTRMSIAMRAPGAGKDRKSTRLNSSHVKISYAVFCLKKKKRIHH